MSAMYWESLVYEDTIPRFTRSDEMSWSDPINEYSKYKTNLIIVNLWKETAHCVTFLWDYCYTISLNVYRLTLPPLRVHIIVKIHRWWLLSTEQLLPQVQQLWMSSSKWYWPRFEDKQYSATPTYVYSELTKFDVMSQMIASSAQR